MEFADHYALSSGLAPVPDGRSVQLTVIDLGELRIESGLLGACDPFVNLDAPLVIPVVPGSYPVRVTIADVSEGQDGSHLREAYLSVVLSEADSVAVEPAPSIEGAPEAGQSWGVPVDAGTVGFVDAEAAATFMPGQGVDWYAEIFDSGEPDSWFAQMDSDHPLPAGLANIVLPLAMRGENLILCRSGWGDGFYPITRTLGADGTTTGIHIDLCVVGAPDEGEEQEAPNTGHPAEWRTWIGRLLRQKG
jgi:hypothetical protein